MGDNTEFLEKEKKKLNVRLIWWLCGWLINIFFMSANNIWYDIIKMILTVYLVVVFVIYIRKIKAFVPKKVIVFYSFWMLLGFCLLYLKYIIQFISQYL